jgi:hypothetical protein
MPAASSIMPLIRRPEADAGVEHGEDVGVNVATGDDATIMTPPPADEVLPRRLDALADAVVVEQLLITSRPPIRYPTWVAMTAIVGRSEFRNTCLLRPGSESPSDTPSGSRRRPTLSRRARDARGPT